MSTVYALTAYAAWDILVKATNTQGATAKQIEAAYVAYDNKVMETLPLVLANHPGPPPPRRRPS